MRVEGKACAEATGTCQTHTTYTDRHLSRKPTATAFFACSTAAKLASTQSQKEGHGPRTHIWHELASAGGREDEAVGGEKGGAEQCVRHQQSWAASRACTRGGELCKGSSGSATRAVVTVAGDPTVAYAVRQVSVSTSRLEGSLMV